jgi:hypothetical protein
MALVAGVASAIPIDPVIEGREPSPVVREYHLTEKPRQENGTGPCLPPSSKWDEQVSLHGLLHELLDACEMFLHPVAISPSTLP